MQLLALLAWLLLPDLWLLLPDLWLLLALAFFGLAFLLPLFLHSLLWLLLPLALCDLLGLGTIGCDGTFTQDFGAGGFDTHFADELASATCADETSTTKTLNAITATKVEWNIFLAWIV